MNESKSKPGVLWYIEAPHFVAGLVVLNGKVIEAAPILGWATGKDWSYVKGYLKKKGYNGQPLKAQ